MNKLKRQAHNERKDTKERQSLRSNNSRSYLSTHVVFAGSKEEEDEGYVTFCNADSDYGKTTTAVLADKSGHTLEISTQGASASSLLRSWRLGRRTY